MKELLEKMWKIVFRWGYMADKHAGECLIVFRNQCMRESTGWGGRVDELSREGGVSVGWEQ